MVVFANNVGSDGLIFARLSTDVHPRCTDHDVPRADGVGPGGPDGQVGHGDVPWSTVIAPWLIWSRPGSAASSLPDSRSSPGDDGPMAGPEVRRRPFVLLSAAVSVDGAMDDAGAERLVLSGAADLDRVDEVRAGCDAILVGAETLRRDDPRLLVRSARRRADRVSRGLPEHPLKVTVTGSGDLDPELRFWHHGGDKLVLTTDGAVARVRGTLGDLADVAGTGPEVDWGRALDLLGERGIGRLLVEGGGRVHTQLLALDLADELHLAVAPLLVGQAGAARFLYPADYPGGPAARMRLLEARAVGDIVLLRYAPKDRR
jgi:riboflavin-specific deaminase-like protein